MRVKIVLRSFPWHNASIEMSKALNSTIQWSNSVVKSYVILGYIPLCCAFINIVIFVILSGVFGRRCEKFFDACLADDLCIFLESLCALQYIYTAVS